MKLLKIIFIAGFFILMSTANIAYALIPVTLDGKLSSREWSESQRYAMFTNELESNCAISFAVVSIVEFEKTGEIFLGFNVEEKCMAEYFDESSEYYGDNSPIGILLTVNNSTQMSAYINGETTSDLDLYHLTAAFLPNSDFGYTAEVRLGVKLDFTKNIDLTVRLIDAVGETSTLHRISLVHEFETTTEKPESTTKVRTTKPTTTKITTTKPTTTSKPTTTKPATTAKATTTKITTNATTQRTTKPTTAKPVTSTTEIMLTTEPVTTSAKPTTTDKKAMAGRVKSSASTSPAVAEISEEVTTAESATTLVVITSTDNENNVLEMSGSQKIIISVCLTAAMTCLVFVVLFKLIKK